MHLNQFKLLDRTDVQSLYIAHGIVSVLKIFVWLNNPRGQCDLYVFRDWCPLELCSHSSLSVRAALQVDILSTHWWSFPQSHNDETQERFGKNGGLEQGFLNFNVHMTTPPQESCQNADSASWGLGWALRFCSPGCSWVWCRDHTV